MDFIHTKVHVANAFLLISKKRKPVLLTRRNRKISAGFNVSTVSARRDPVSKSSGSFNDLLSVNWQT